MLHDVFVTLNVAREGDWDERCQTGGFLLFSANEDGGAALPEIQTWCFYFWFFTVQLSVPLAAAMLMELGGKIKLKKEVL